jgi:hypothetical protein
MSVGMNLPASGVQIPAVSAICSIDVIVPMHARWYRKAWAASAAIVHWLAEARLGRQYHGCR